MKLKIWVIVGESESGDFCGPDVVPFEPDDAYLSKWCYEYDGDPDEEGPGNYGSYVYCNVTEHEIEF